jgi:pyruvate dehydrogenase E1 component alpha subunit
MVRLKLYLKAKGLWTEEVDRLATEEGQKKIDAAVQEAEAVPPPEPEDIFKYVFAEMTMPLKEQLEYLKSTLS